MQEGSGQGLRTVPTLNRAGMTGGQWPWEQAWKGLSALESCPMTCGQWVPSLASPTPGPEVGEEVGREFPSPGLTAQAGRELAASLGPAYLPSHTNLTALSASLIPHQRQK